MNLSLIHGIIFGLFFVCPVKCLLACAFQLMSESLKAKQLQTSLQAEKQVLASRMQHAHAAVDVYKQRVTRLEEQVCFLDFEPISMSFCFMQCAAQEELCYNVLEFELVH